MSPIVRLGDVAKFVRGITFKPEDVVSPDSADAVWCFRTKNVQTELDMSDVWAVPERFIKSPDRYLQAGDVLVSSANSWNLVGKCCWVPELGRKATFGGFVSVLRACDESVDHRYLFRWFSSPRVQETLRSFGQQTTNISNLNIERCLALPLPLPPRAAQSRAVDVLDEAEGLRGKRHAAYGKLDDLTQSIFLDMFGDPATNPHGWRVAELGSLAVRFSDGPFGSNLKSEHYAEDGVRVVRLQNIGEGQFVDRDRVYISSAHFERLRKHECLPGDVLIATLGDPNLRACIQPDFVSLALNKADCVQMRVDEQAADGRWACALLNQPSTLALAQNLMHGQTRVRISMGRLRRLVVPVPPIDLQRLFAQRANAQAQLFGLQERSLQAFDALFASLQHRAFNGDL